MKANAVQELEDDALLGELARPLTHEFNNFLNTLLLQFAVMEQEGTAGARLGAIRKEAKLVASQIQAWQRIKKDADSDTEDVDLNEIVRDVVASFAHGSAIIEASLSTSPALVRGSAIKLKRLCSLMLNDASAAVSRSASNKARVQTIAGPKENVLIVEDNRGGVSTADMDAWFDFRGADQSSRKLQRIAAHGLARRLGGSLQAEKGKADALVIRLTLPASSSS
jgi:C4-dicarboxylate-specific signal transduction histidine kinase